MSEYSINATKIESLMLPQKVLFQTLIETTLHVVDSSNRLRPELPNISRAIPEANELMKKQWQAMVVSQIIDIWKGIGNPTSASQFESIINSPSKKLSGFHLRDNVYPIFPASELKDKDLLVLDESQLKQVYMAVGGDKQKAEQMFPTPKISPTEQS